MNFIQALKALKLGHELRDPKTWKDRHQLLNAVSFITLMVINWLVPDTTISEEVLTNINEGVVFFMLAFNAYLIPATTKKTGVGDDDETEVPAE
jgi:hypothetical protein